MTVALSWIVLSIMGAVPFVISGSIPHPVDALFETVSGFTTTGASILTDVRSTASLYTDLEKFHTLDRRYGSSGLHPFFAASYRRLPHEPDESRKPWTIGK